MGVQEINYLEHYGVKGMRWGIRRTPEQLGHVRVKKKQPRTVSNRPGGIKTSKHAKSLGNKVTSFLSDNHDKMIGVGILAGGIYASTKISQSPIKLSLNVLSKINDGIKKYKDGDYSIITEFYGKPVSSLKPPKFRSKKEYAHVRSEINTWLKDQHRRVYGRHTKFINLEKGTYDILFEVFSDQDFRILGKHKVK